MKKLFVANLVILATLSIDTAFGSTSGELWKVTSTTTMPHVSQHTVLTSQLCLPKGAARDPHLSTPNMDSDCQITNVKDLSNKVSWKIDCNTEGVKISGTGELHVDTDSYHGIMHCKLKFTDMSGKNSTDGSPYTTTYTGKRLGKSCVDNQSVLIASGKG